ncbi:hypothetical protein Q7P36_009419 [Cladosporium allicinum]
MHFSKGRRALPELNTSVTPTVTQAPRTATTLPGLIFLQTARNHECANTYNILRYYGDQVEAAAKDCGLTATFSPSAAASSGSAAAETSATASSESSSSDSITVTTETTSQIETSTPVAVAVTSINQTAVASGTILPSPSSNGTSNATPSAVPTGEEEFDGTGAKFGSHAGAIMLSAFVVLQCLLQ